MKPHNNTFSELRRELDFLDRGGYRVEPRWRLPLFFEDSPICTRARYGACPHSCALMSFVPMDLHHEPAPCRHIPLNETGETLHTMYRTATMDEIEAALRSWLLRILGECSALREIRADDKQVA